ncbi:MAG: proteasome-type protease [Jaaginema sp. PMC 1079.18]|nr:proteasome-type protease [Jaaginema sp. PMC 1080.18]MEC4853319.1 proteasome-type protease [Jaaginema sp. PMC 1079.18]MEC4866735.1 proteasome-type protease [Jaaginema sp. PMC 1078.18]
MTYCLGILNRSGLVMASDSRTNAGVDYISAYRKLFEFCNPGDRALILCSSGNLSVSQGIITQLKREIQNQAEINLFNLPTLYEVTRYIGNKMRAIQDENRQWLERDNIDYQCNILVGGQIKGEETQLYQIYPQGNFIQATPETPFLQIGETKYGKPILDRTLTFDTSLDAVAKCALLSIDSTMKSNISVGPPINLAMYQSESLTLRHSLELRLGAPYLAKMRKLWQESLRQAFDAVPNVEWEQAPDPEDILID